VERENPRLSTTGDQFMKEMDKHFGNLTQEEFQQLAEQILAPDFHDLTAEEFSTALAALDEEGPHESVELLATVADGQLKFLEPAPFEAHDNELRFGARRVVIRLVSEFAAQAGATTTSSIN
jgi:hypothetical protein